MQNWLGKGTDLVVIVQEALEAAALIMNDGEDDFVDEAMRIDLLIISAEVEQAEVELAKGTSPFHKVRLAHQDDMLITS